MDLEEKTLEKCYVYKGKIINLRRDKVLLPNGNESFREIVEHRGGASVLAVDGEENVYLVSQFRYPYGEVVQEIPAGKLEPNEEPSFCALRELEEETGLKAEKLTDYGVLYPTPGYTNERLYVFLATDFTKTSTHLDADEFINIEKVPLQEAYGRIQRGEIKDAKTVYAITRYLLEKHRRED